MFSRWGTPIVAYILHYHNTCTGAAHTTIGGFGILLLEKQFELADNCGLANCALTHGQTANVAKSMPATQCVGVQLVLFI